MAYEDKVSGHYGRGDLVETILAALREAGKDTGNLTPEDLAPVDHFHGRGLEATRDLMDMLDAHAGIGAASHLLDLGSGLGGTARYLAARFGCRVTGIDLTPDFCRTAERLTELTGLSDRAEFRQGSVLDLPFDAASFDAAYSQNVSMNIADKARFHAEAFRVLKPGGYLALSELCQGAAGEIIYPVPWAETPETSHVVTIEETTASLGAAGFEVVVAEDAANRFREFYARQRERNAREGSPKLGIHLILGARIKAMGPNTARNVEEGRTIPYEVLCRKP
jgi:SAM-dependent methyltransferase